MVAVALLATTLVSCHQKKTEQLTSIQGYDFDKVVVEDYDFVASQYQQFFFYEADAVFNDVLSSDGDHYITSVKTIFQVGDTCIMIEHLDGQYEDEPIINYIAGHWMECMEMNARNKVSFSHCMDIHQDKIKELRTRYMTMRRILAPPFPENAQYIFGKGLMIVDAQTGEIQ